MLRFEPGGEFVGVLGIIVDIGHGGDITGSRSQPHQEDIETNKKGLYVLKVIIIIAAIEVGLNHSSSPSSLVDK